MATTYIQRTPSTTGTPTKFTYSVWFKRGTLGAYSIIGAALTSDSSNYKCALYLNSNDKIQFEQYGTGLHFNYETDRKFRDVGAWYHLVVRYDSTDVTAGDRIKMYVNGVEITDWGTETNPGSSQVCYIGSTQDYFTDIGNSVDYGYFNGEMSHIHFIDGTAYDASTFGETDATSGIWKIKTSPSVTYGTNGFFLKMEDRTNLDLDSGTNAFTMTTGGTLTATYDNPSNNFCTMNPNNNRSLNTYSNGNNTIVGYGDGYSRAGFGTMAVSASKWYWEIKINSTIPGNTAIGICNLDGINLNSDLRFAPFRSGSLYSYGYKFNGEKITVGTSSSYGNTYTNGDYIGCAFDLDNNKIYFSKNGTWQDSGDPTSGGTGTGAAFTLQSGEDYMPSQFFDNGPTVQFNFGNGYFGTDLITSPEADDAGLGAFKYDVPAGYYCLCTKNIKAYGG